MAIAFESKGDFCSLESPNMHSGLKRRNHIDAEPPLMLLCFSTFSFFGQEMADAQRYRAVDVRLDWPQDAEDRQNRIPQEASHGL
jgi:hypothetical protein